MSRIRDILSLPSPREHFKSIYDIDFQRLKRLGMTTLLFDYDNTLAPWKSLDVGNRTLELFENLLRMGFKVCVVTNAPSERGKDIIRRFRGQIPVFGSMRKPGIKKLKLVLRFLDSEPENTVLTGDLFFTDIIAGNRAGMYTILVNPYTQYTQEVKNWITRAAERTTRWSYKFYFYTIGWFFRLIYLISPHETYDHWKSVDFRRLKDLGFKNIIFDMDNTLARWKAPDVDDDTVKRLKALITMGYRIVIMSNTRKTGRLFKLKRRIGEGFEVSGKMGKPFPAKARGLMKRLKMNNAETLFIGDQLFTDILTGNLLKTYTIKVDPIDLEYEFPGTKIFRRLEKFFATKLRKHPTVKGRSMRVDKNDEDQKEQE